MSKLDELIIDKLRDVCRQPAVTLQGEVQSVDEAAFTCVVRLANGMDLLDVHLKTLKEAPNGFVMIPKIGTTAIVLNIGNPDFLVISAEEIDKIIADVDGTKIEISKDLLQINGGKNGGLIIITALLQRLNAVENDLNALKEAVTKWIPSPNDGGLALRVELAGASLPVLPEALPGTWAGSPIIKTKRSDIENPKVKH